MDLHYCNGQKRYDFSTDEGSYYLGCDPKYYHIKDVDPKAFRRGYVKALFTENRYWLTLIENYHMLVPGKGSKARTKIATIEEYLALCGVAPVHLKPMIITAINTDMRPSEIRTLKWSYIDKDKTLIVLPPEVTKEGKKTKREKRIPINYHVRAVLDDQPHALHHDYVFTYKRNPIRGPQGIRKAFKTACEAVSILYGKKTPGGLIFSDFRRTVKTYMVEAGFDKVYRDTILGHSLKGMDVHYINPQRKL